MRRLGALKPRNHEEARKKGRSKVRDALVVKFQYGTKQTLGMLDVIVTIQNGTKQTLSMLDANVTFQDGADLEQTDILLSRFLALVTCTGPHQHTEHPSTQLRIVFFVNPINRLLGIYQILKWLCLLGCAANTNFTLENDKASKLFHITS